MQLVGDSMEITLKLEAVRHHGRYTLTLKANGASILIDKFDGFCEIDERMRNRLGVTWELFRDDIRNQCDR